MGAFGCCFTFVPVLVAFAAGLSLMSLALGMVV